MPESNERENRQVPASRKFSLMFADSRGLKARRIIAQGKRSEMSAALGNQSKRNQALKGRQKTDKPKR
jgi:hypothetical protein